LSSATHHIFFPPRLEVVVEEQNPDRFPSHAWDQSALHRFLGHQSHSPAGATLWWVTAHHGNDPLLLAVYQNRRSTGPLLVVQRGFEATRLVTMADLPNRLRREWDHAGNPRCTNALGQLQERHGSQDDTDLLYAAAQQPRQFVLVFRFDFDTQGWASHARSMRQNISNWNCFLELFQAVTDLVATCHISRLKHCCSNRSPRKTYCLRLLAASTPFQGPARAHWICHDDILGSLFDQDQRLRRTATSILLRHDLEICGNVP